MASSKDAIGSGNQRRYRRERNITKLEVGDTLVVEGGTSASPVTIKGGSLAGDVLATKLNIGANIVATDEGNGQVKLDGTGGSGAVTSVNGDAGPAVVLDPDSLNDGATVNKFTNAADIAKLAGIEALADVTDATNVAAAGATMNTDTALSGNGYFLNDAALSANDATKVASQASIKAYVDNAVIGGMTYKGNYDAATNTPNLDAASPVVTAVGDTYLVSVAGTFFTTTVEVGDSLVANVANAAVESDWNVVQANLTPASIKAQYEGNADTNAYTDAEKAKLTGVEANATADQTAAEIETAYNAQVVAMDQTTAEAGTSTTVQRVTAQRIAQAIAKQTPIRYVINASDVVTDLTTGVAKVTFRLPSAMTLTEVRASVGVAPTGSALIADINVGGVSILGNKLSIDAGATTSVGATIPATIITSVLADNAEVSIDIDQIGSVVAGNELVIYLIGAA